MRERRAEAEARWRGLVSEQVESGKSMSAFCRDRGLRASQLFSWKKRFRGVGAAKFLEVAVHPPLEALPALAARGSAIEVRLNGGRSLVVEPGFNANHLRALLAVLESEA
jgi:transposase-like protein